jgi:hypothetical protein
MGHRHKDSRNTEVDGRIVLENDESKVVALVWK